MRLPGEIATARDWRKLMQTLGGRSTEVLLMQFVLKLSTVSDGDRSATTAWQACLPGDTFSAQLAAKILSGLLTAIMSAHNDVRSLLRHLNDSVKNCR